MLSDLALLPNSALSVLGLILGLLVGSFLNVVIFRYPNLLKHQWTVQSRAWLELAPTEDPPPPGIISPASHCGHCGSSVKPWQNIPILSFLLLRGKCGSCKKAIGWRYPMVELLTGMLCAIVVYQFGWSLQSAFGLLLTWVLVALTFIDFDHQLLPDDIVLTTLWLGIGLSLVPVYTDPKSSIIGAIAGYLAFWMVFQLFLRLTGKEGMGYGDFKLLSLLGAWLGWQYLPQIILLSTLIGSVFGILLMIRQRAGGDTAIPFGPYIALAGWIALCWGDQINSAYAAYSGY
ncbi:A24 family peptidase [Arenicella sp. 4NH20-0111]|uniref:prepilin peptidase n=1 Tax=Arenicella sp. 4NH20-0111 TaxID=3127648 RepID=UPI0033412066